MILTGGRLEERQRGAGGLFGDLSLGALFLVRSGECLSRDVGGLKLPVIRSCRIGGYRVTLM